MWNTRWCKDVCLCLGDTGLGDTDLGDKCPGPACLGGANVRVDLSV